MLFFLYHKVCVIYFQFPLSKLPYSRSGKEAHSLPFPLIGPVFAFGDSVGGIGQVPTFHTNGMNFGYFVCNSQQGRYRSERNSPEIHVQSGDNDSYPVVSQFVADINQTFVKNCASSIPTTSLSEEKSKMLAEESIGVEAIELLSCDTTSSSE